MENIMNIDNVENRALKMGVLISAIMAIAGWTTFYFSGSEATLLDGILSLGIGLAFLLIMFVPEGSSVSFLISIGDAIIVLIMCLIFLRIPFKIIKDSFIELGGRHFIIQRKCTPCFNPKISKYSA